MPSKKIIKKEVLKEKVKKPLPKKVAKSLPEETSVVGKIVNLPHKTIRQENNFGLINIIAIIAVIILIILAAIGTDSLKRNKKNAPQEVASTQSISYDCEANKTALTVLQEKNDVKTQDSQFGVYVDSINGIQNDNENFWIPYVNGQMSNISPDQYNCQTGDKVEWRFEKFLNSN